MVSAFGISVSGLQAASTRFAASANNTANAFSTKSLKNGQVIDEPYHAQKSQQISNSLGGVLKVEVSDANPPTKVIFNPTAENADANGASRVPNVDLEKEMIDQQIAAYDYKANLKAIKVQNNLLDSTLNIIS